MRTVIRFLVFALIFALGLPAAAFAAEKLPSGLIAMSESTMNWADAKAFCEQQGGRLPLINGSISLESVPVGATIDGCGAMGAPWPSGLPHGSYWTGTEDSSNPGLSWNIGIGDDYVVGPVGAGDVGVAGEFQRDSLRVVCVPK